MNLENGRAAGMDDISYELYKWGGASMIDLLVQLFRVIWSNEKVPERWNESRVTVAQRGGIRIRMS